MGTDTQQNEPQPPDADLLVLDGQSLRDLEVFVSDPPGASLFEFCNVTRTNGGAKALRRRMEQPWSNGSRIQQTQESLSFILNHRDAFDELPLAYTINRVDRYLRDFLPIVTHTNPIEFAIGAISLWSGSDRDYQGIASGVRLSCELVGAVHKFMEQMRQVEASGELSKLLSEIQEILADPLVAAVPASALGSWPMRVLRLDQTFRMTAKGSLLRLMALIYEIDGLVAMADTCRNHNFAFPEITDGPLRVNATKLTHPFLDEAQANPATLDQRRRVLFLTGPNMAGKTTYLRAFATALYLAHLGMGVPAGTFQFVPAQRLFTTISLSDDLRGGISYFRAEALRIKAVASSLSEGYRVVAVMDEPFKGTNVKDALDASSAVLTRLSSREDCLIMFSSHLIELSEQLRDNKQIDCRYFEADEGDGRLRFDYQLRSGVSSQRLGMRVLKEEGVFDLLDKSGSK